MRFIRTRSHTASFYTSAWHATDSQTPTRKARGWRPCNKLIRTIGIPGTGSSAFNLQTDATFSRVVCLIFFFCNPSAGMCNLVQSPHLPVCNDYVTKKITNYFRKNGIGKWKLYSTVTRYLSIPWRRKLEC